jgi:hypothetical protein
LFAGSSIKAASRLFDYPRMGGNQASSFHALRRMMELLDSFHAPPKNREKPRKKTRKNIKNPLKKRLEQPPKPVK